MKHKSLLFASVFLLSTFNLNAEMTPINKWQDACPFEEEVVVYTISPKTLLGENIRRDTFIIDIKNPNLFVGYIPNGLRSFFIGGETELLSYLATGLIKDGEIETMFRMNR